jgi:5-methyltetrahydropteroyltriglutamate--homocysteine methyltransferase
MKQSTDRILTTHVGSIIRPNDLIESAKQFAAGGDARAYDRILARSIDEVVKRQAEVGLDVVNDGEFGKSSWAKYAFDRITGFESRPDKLYPALWLGRDRVRFAQFMADEFPRGVKGTPGHACVGPIKYKDRTEVERALKDLKAAAAQADVEEVFFTAVAPASVGYDAEIEYYRDERDYLFALADALREEYLAIYESGVILQVDDAALANLYDEYVQESPKRYRDWAMLRIEALNHALRGIPPERVRYHICFGSWHVPHVADAPLAEIVDLILKVNAAGICIEAANVRHEHEWRVWEHAKLPDGKVLIPGVITHHTGVVEHPELVAERIGNFAGVVGRERVIAGTDCGFSQSVGVQRTHPQVMWAKYEALAEGARIASKKLWTK